MRLIIDCDPGNGVSAADVDDGFALALAWASPEVDLAGITIVSGNVEHEVGARVAVALRDLAGRDTAVFEGTSLPVVEDGVRWRAALNARRDDELARELWSGRSEPRGERPAGTDAAEALVELLDSDEPTVLVALGPLTNLAAAELKRPGLLAGCDRVVVLGGAFTGPGGVRELNFALDPEAADVVLTSGAPLVLVPLDVTRNSWLTHDDLDVLEASTSALVAELVDSARPWVSWISGSRDWPGANAHDILATAIALDPTIAEYASQVVRVDTSDGPNRSRPYLVDDQSESQGRVQRVTAFDDERFTSMFLRRLTEYGDNQSTTTGDSDD